MKTLVIQTDNRPTLDFLQKTRQINQIICGKYGFDYRFIEMQEEDYRNMHPTMGKIKVIHSQLELKEYDYLIFLDSDAWIHNPKNLIKLIEFMSSDTQKIGAFSREPKARFNTLINSGTFILKNTDKTIKMYQEIMRDVSKCSTYHNKFPHDQFYICKYIQSNLDQFLILKPNILNTPFGKILRHNWFKGSHMQRDLNRILANRAEREYELSIEDSIDRSRYPNILPIALDYFSYYFTDLKFWDTFFKGRNKAPQPKKD